MLRRTGTGTLGNPGKDIVNKITMVASELLKWDSKRIKDEVASLIDAYRIL